MLGNIQYRTATPGRLYCIVAQQLIVLQLPAALFWLLHEVSLQLSQQALAKDVLHHTPVLRIVSLEGDCWLSCFENSYAFQVNTACSSLCFARFAGMHH